MAPSSSNDTTDARTARQSSPHSSDLPTDDRVARMLARGLLRLGRFTARLTPTWRQRRKLRNADAVWFDIPSDSNSNRCLEACHVPRHPDATPQHLIVMAHGHGECKESLAQPAIDMAYQGHDVILFDLRAHGRSDGQVSTFGYREANDFARVLDAAQARSLITNPAITLGFSAGAVAALCHAPTDPRVSAVIAIAPYISLRQGTAFFLKRMAPSVAHPALLRGLELAAHESGFNPEDPDAREAARQITQPALFLCGSADGRFRLTEQVKAIHDAKTQGPRALHDFDASHFKLLHAKWHAMRPIITTFIRDHT